MRTGRWTALWISLLLAGCGAEAGYEGDGGDGADGVLVIISVAGAIADGLSHDEPPPPDPSTWPPPGWPPPPPGPNDPYVCPPPCQPSPPLCAGGPPICPMHGNVCFQVGDCTCDTTFCIGG